MSDPMIQIAERRARNIRAKIANLEERLEAEKVKLAALLGVLAAFGEGDQLEIKIEEKPTGVKGSLEKLGAFNPKELEARIERPRLRLKVFVGFDWVKGKILDLSLAILSANSDRWWKVSDVHRLISEALPEGSDQRWGKHLKSSIRQRLVDHSKVSVPSVELQREGKLLTFRFIEPKE